MKPVLRYLTCLLALTPMVLGGSPAEAGGCKVDVGVCLVPDGSCVGVPTSLRPLSTFAKKDADGWFGKSACGTQSCLLVFRCPCGNQLSNDLCEAGTPISECDCGMGVPCEALSGPPAKVKMDELLRDQVIVVPGRPAGWDKEELVGEQEFQHLRSGRLRVKGGSALTALKSRFSRLDSVHIKATARVVKFLGAEQEGANQEHVAGLGQFEYWASGDKYRVNSSSDPALGLEGDSQTAWNSKEFQFFRPSDSVLSIQRTDPGMVSAALPNPFFLETMFLTRDSDSCPTCLTSPGDLRNARRWSRVLDRAHSEETAQRAGETVLVPGQVLHGLPLVYRLAFQGGGAGTKLESIDRLTRGRVLSTTRFSDYRPADQGGGEFARHIEEHVYDDAGNVLAHLGWTIDVVEINQVIPDEIFTIDRESAPAIWDSETGRFTKHWRFEE